MSKCTALSQHFDIAMSALAQLILLKATTPYSLKSLLPLIQRIEYVDPDNALLVARIMQQSSAFNEVLRTKVSSIDIGARIVTIAREFDSILDNTRDMATWMDDGRMDWEERAQLAWMEIRRGTEGKRFEKIIFTFGAVLDSTEEQIDAEEFVLSAYHYFRLSVREAQSAAYAIQAKADVNWQCKQAELKKIGDAISTAQSDQQKSGLEWKLDQLITSVKSAETVYQVAKDLAENLMVAYNTSEIIFARLQQNIAMKRRILEKSAEFFGATFFGATIDVISFAKLTEAIVEYQSSMNTLVSELRDEASVNAAEIATVTNNDIRGYYR